MSEKPAAELEPEVRLIKINADDESRTLPNLGALLLLGGGRIVARTAGAMDARRIVDWMRTQLAQAA